MLPIRVTLVRSDPSTCASATITNRSTPLTFRTSATTTVDPVGTLLPLPLSESVRGKRGRCARQVQLEAADERHVRRARERKGRRIQPPQISRARRRPTLPEERSRGFRLAADTPPPLVPITLLRGRRPARQPTVIEPSVTSAGLKTCEGAIGKLATSDWPDASSRERYATKSCDVSSGDTCAAAAQHDHFHEVAAQERAAAQGGRCSRYRWWPAQASDRPRVRLAGSPRPSPAHPPESRLRRSTEAAARAPQRLAHPLLRRYEQRELTRFDEARRIPAAYRRERQPASAPARTRMPCRSGRAWRFVPPAIWLRSTSRSVAGNGGPCGASRSTMLSGVHPGRKDGDRPLAADRRQRHAHVRGRSNAPGGITTRHHRRSPSPCPPNSA